MRECLVEVGLRAVDRRLSFRDVSGCAIEKRIGFVKNGLRVDFDADSSRDALICLPHLLQLAHCLLLSQLNAVFGVFKLIIKLILEHRV